MKKLPIILVLVLFCLLCSCTTTRKDPATIDPTNYNQLMNLSETAGAKPLVDDASHLRYKALEDTGMSLGAQGGLAWSSKAINAGLDKDKWYLETIYNFNGMMLSHGVLSPVLEQGNNSLNLDDPNTIRIADKTYQIVKQARFATTPPNWREYIWMPFNPPAIPHKVLLPRTPDEKKIWQKAIKIGWERGTEQAKNIFQQNLARLKRDFNGMTLYRELLQKNMVSPPYVSKTELGVTGDGNDLRVNDQVLRITVLPKLETDSNRWKAIVVKENGIE